MFSFFFRKKNNIRNALSFIGYDMHNHILPGIDDGSPDIDTSLQIIEGLQELGYKGFICTPHILSDLYPNTPGTIKNSFESLEPSLKEKNESCSIGFAAEYMVDYDFEKLVGAGSLLSYGNEKSVLIEMSYLVESSNLKNMIFSLLTAGYQPILAHPERYSYYHHKLDIYEDLVHSGCELQLNLLSLGGHYGGRIKEIGKKLVKKGLINWLGTDIHHIGHLELLSKLAADTKTVNLLSGIKGLKNPEITF